MNNKQEKAIGSDVERDEISPAIIVDSPAPRDQEKLKLFVAIARSLPSCFSVIQDSIFGHRKLIAQP